MLLEQSYFPLGSMKCSALSPLNHFTTLLSQPFIICLFRMCLSLFLAGSTCMLLIEGVSLVSFGMVLIPVYICFSKFASACLIHAATPVILLEAGRESEASFVPAPLFPLNRLEGILISFVWVSAAQEHPWFLLLFVAALSLVLLYFIIV